MKFAIVVFPGSSGDVDVQHALTNVMQVQADIIWHTDAGEKLEQYDAAIIPSGAAYGDYLRAGALAKSSPAAESLIAFAQSGKPVLGVGNGFQVLTELDLLPGAFLLNKGIKFNTGKAKLTVQNTDSQFTSSYEAQQTIELPFAHQYGNYYIGEDKAAELKKAGRVVLTYKEDNPDGSSENIAGILNEQGNVLGVMPLPERSVEEMIGGIDGLPLFQSILKNWSENNVSQS